MKSDLEPPRMLDTGCDTGLGALLRAGRDDLPTESEMGQLAARLGPLLGGPFGGEPSTGAAPAGDGGASAAGASTGAVATASGISMTIKVGAALLLAGAATTAGTLGTWPFHRDVSPAHVAEVTASSSTPPAELPISTVPADSAVPSADQPRETEAPKAAPPPHAASQGSAGTVSLPNQESEVQLLQRAQDALGGNPSQALALTVEHARRFPSGSLAQEREVVAVTALSRMGRQAEARNRAERFARSYPRSPHVRRLEVIVGGSLQPED